MDKRHATVTDTDPIKTVAGETSADLPNLSETIKADPKPSAPRLLDGDTVSTPIRPVKGCLINVGDFIARLGDGAGCPASAWPHAGSGDRRAFAAAFLGCSASYVDPNKPIPPQITVMRGGNWSCAVRGPVKAKDLLGPAIGENGSLSPRMLERVESVEEAIAVAVEEESGLWRVRLLAKG